MVFFFLRKLIIFVFILTSENEILALKTYWKGRRMGEREKGRKGGKEEGGNSTSL